VESWRTAGRDTTFRGRMAVSGDRIQHHGADHAGDSEFMPLGLRQSAGVLLVYSIARGMLGRKFDAAVFCSVLPPNRWSMGVWALQYGRNVGRKPGNISGGHAEGFRGEIGYTLSAIVGVVIYRFSGSRQMTTFRYLASDIKRQREVDGADPTALVFLSKVERMGRIV